MEAELAERESAAALYEELGRRDEAADLRREAAVLAALLGDG